MFTRLRKVPECTADLKAWPSLSPPLQLDTLIRENGFRVRSVMITRNPRR
jgi:hypothetical protein